MIISPNTVYVVVNVISFVFCVGLIAFFIRHSIKSKEDRIPSALYAALILLVLTVSVISMTKQGFKPVPTNGKYDEAGKFTGITP